MDHVDTLLRELAKRTCATCYGTGRIGFRDGRALVCGCATREHARLAPYVKGFANDPIEAVELVRAARALADAYENPADTSGYGTVVEPPMTPSSTPGRVNAKMKMFVPCIADRCDARMTLMLRNVYGEMFADPYYRCANKQCRYGNDAIAKAECRAGIDILNDDWLLAQGAAPKRVHDGYTEKDVETYS